MWLVPRVWQVPRTDPLFPDPLPLLVVLNRHHRHLVVTCFPSLSYHPMIQGTMEKLRPTNIEHFASSCVAGKTH